MDKFLAFIAGDKSVIDIGAGTCHVSEILMNRGYKVTPVDVNNLSFVDSIEPVIFDGTKLPFKDDEFDVALLLTVLHHTPDPELVLNEAKRVAKKVVVIEDIYLNPFHRYLTYFFDSAINLEFFGHPHSNKSDREWKEVFKKLGFRVAATEYSSTLFVFRLAIYHLERV